MTKISEQILSQLTSKLNKSIKEETKFFDKPDSLKLLFATAIGVLSKFSDELISKILKEVNFDLSDEKELKKFLKNNNSTNNILKYTNQSLNDDILNNIIINCETIQSGKSEGVEELKTYSNISSENISAYNDIINKIDKNKSNFFNLIDENSQYILSGILLIYTLKLTINLFKDTEFPSIYRTKYIQKLVRISLSSVWNKSSDEFNSVKSTFTKIDEFLILISAATTLYLVNKKSSQKSAEKILLDKGCKDLSATDPYKGKTSDEISAEVVSKPLNILPICIDPVFEEPVPKEPYENKQDNFTCEIPVTPEEPDVVSKSIPELAVKARIENKRSKEMIPMVVKGAKVTDKTVIANIDGLSVYSPTNGYINSLQKNIIEIWDINDSQDSFLNQNINSLNSKYEELNNIQLFLKDYTIISLYPIMLANSPLIDNIITAQERLKIKYNGMQKTFDKIEEQWNKLLKDYEKNVQNITGEKNVKNNAENETLFKIKEDLDKEQSKLYSYLKKIESESIQLSQQTLPVQGEFQLVEYYLFEMLFELFKEENVSDILKNYRNSIYRFAQERYSIDKYNKSKLANKGAELLGDLKKGKQTDIEKVQLWNTGLNKFNAFKKIDDVKKWLKDLGKENKSLEENKKTKLISRITFIYEFYFEIDEFTKKYPNLKDKNNKEQTSKESNYISNYFSKLWVRLSALPNEIKDIEKNIDSLSLTSRYYLKEEDTQYRIYTIPNESKKSECNSSLVKNTAHELNDINYWLKYCGIATLCSVINPVTGWSTGIILPSGPLKLPTVYIPIKPIETNYGFILIGLTITGIWVYPLILYANLSGDFVMPISALDPTGLIKQGVKTLKQQISDELIVFKKSTLKIYLDNTYDEIKNVIEPEIRNIEDLILANKLIRPSKKQTKKYINWCEEKLSLNKTKKELKLKKWSLEKKYKLVNSAYNGGKIKNSEISDPKLTALEKSQDNIDKQLDKLTSLIDKISLTLSVLPGVLNPYEANFGITLKNPKLAIQIEDELNDNVNEETIGEIFNDSRLDNEEFMKGVVEFNYSKYESAISLAILSNTLIKKDPFPSYENLSLDNFAWMSFINLSFVPTGAKSYGIPGNSPM